MTKSNPNVFGVWPAHNPRCRSARRDVTPSRLLRGQRSLSGSESSDDDVIAAEGAAGTMAGAEGRRSGDGALA